MLEFKWVCELSLSDVWVGATKIFVEGANYHACMVGCIDIETKGPFEVLY
jgi:hypothetical protein